VAAEMIINVRPLDSLNEDEYEADEKKRIKLLQIRNDYLQRQADEELRTLTIRATMQMNKRMRSGKLPKSFRWFFEKPIDIDAVVAGVSAQLKAVYEPEIAQLKQRVAKVEKPISAPTLPPVLPTWVPTGNPQVPNATHSGETNATNNANATDTGNGKTPPKTPTGSTPSPIPAGRRSVPVKDAAQLLGLSDSYVRDLRNNGTLKRSSTNGSLILMSSILAYQKVRLTTGKSEGKNTDSLPAITPAQISQNAVTSDDKTADKPAANGHAKNTKPLAVNDLVPVEV
jgi:hypothetical protein